MSATKRPRRRASRRVGGRPGLLLLRTPATKLRRRRSGSASPGAAASGAAQGACGSSARSSCARQGTTLNVSFQRLPCTSRYFQHLKHVPTLLGHADMPRLAFVAPPMHAMQFK